MFHIYIYIMFDSLLSVIPYPVDFHLGGIGGEEKRGFHLTNHQGEWTGNYGVRVNCP